MRGLRISGGEGVSKNKREHGFDGEKCGQVDSAGHLLLLLFLILKPTKLLCKDFKTAICGYNQILLPKNNFSYMFMTVLS